MQAKEWDWREEQKKSWGDGPWLKEPDKLQFADEATGLPCLIVRNRMGALCGYVGVAEGHPFFEVEYNQCSLQADRCEHNYCSHTPEHYLNVHGGVTFSDRCEPDPHKEHGICHFPDEGEPDNVWWFGYDCAHSGDYIPSLEVDAPDLARAMWGLTSAILGDSPEGEQADHYKTVDYVKAGCAEMAAQLAAIAQSPVERVINR